MVTLDRFRELAMRLPQVAEQDHFGTPSFRVRGKIFAQFSRGGVDAIFKFSLDELDVMRMSAGDLFTPDPSWGKLARLAMLERLPDEELDSMLDCWAPFPEPTGSTS